ncbi:hypothetical protein FHR72_002766 [Mycolicibacterium iranicum]|uniref:Oligosaccharide repeat unit polymerase n=1 Tax=Mycolicibacterium iranicum TaxID=912594 RepID=A0A839QDD1_MYCIR|nr:hypothetical protein [Mycolicibacterium iranicum]MBB2991282.1 hypothetical protein [Mycolicibacterium iranicum]
MAVLGVSAFLIILFVGFINAPHDWKGAKPILSTYVVALIAIALYIALPAVLVLTSGTYTWAVGYYSEDHFAKAIWLSVLALLAFLYGNLLARPRKFATIEHQVPHPRDDVANPPGESKDLLLYSLLIVGLALKFYLIITTGGFESSVTRFSGYAREFSGVSHLDAEAILLRTLSGIADGAATWGVVQALKRGAHEKVWLLILLATLVLSYITMGKRLVLLLPLVCILLAYNTYRRSLTTRLVPLVLAFSISAGFITLMARAFLPASVLGYDINLENVEYSGGSVVRFYLYSLEFSSLEMISVAMQAGDQINDLFGGAWNAVTTTNFEPFFYSVPRAVWPEKPTVFYDLSYGVSAVLGDTSFEDPTVGYASTLIGTSYIMGGIILVICAMFAFGYLTGRLDSSLNRPSPTEMSIVLYAIALVVVFHLFRQGTLGWTFIVSVVQQYGAIGALIALAWPRTGDNEPHRARFASKTAVK